MNIELETIENLEELVEIDNREKTCSNSVFAFFLQRSSKDNKFSL